MKDIFGKIFQHNNGILRDSHTMEKYAFWIQWLKLDKMPVHGKATDFMCTLSGRCSTRKTSICISPLFGASAVVLSLLSQSEMFCREVPMCTSWPEKPFMDFIEINLVANK